jgi:hypothetical protein
VRRLTKQQREREAWTRHIDGAATAVATPSRCSECGAEIPLTRLKRKTKTCSVECGRKAQTNKYGGMPVEFNGRLYPSVREARVAQKLQLWEHCGEIHDLAYQVRIVLVDGRAGIRSITYWADFTYYDAENLYHVIDAKGMKTDIYKLKKALAFLLHNITIEEM